MIDVYKIEDVSIQLETLESLILGVINDFEREKIIPCLIKRAYGCVYLLQHNIKSIRSMVENEVKNIE